MGQISQPTRADIILTATDRLVARNADGGISGNRLILFGALAGQNSSVSDFVVMGSNSVATGLNPATPGANDGTTVVGAQSLTALLNTTAPAVGEGPITAVGGFIAPLLAQRLGSVVLIGSEIGEDYPAQGADISRSVIMGAQALQRQRTLNVNGPGAQNCVVIGYRAARGVANTQDGAGAHIQSSVIIGTEACENTGFDAAVPGGGISQNVVIGYQAGRTMGGGAANRLYQLSVIIGYQAVMSANRGEGNVSIGALNTLTDNCTFNTLVGYNVPGNTAVAGNNTFIGSNMNTGVGLGTRNVIIGAGAGVGLVGATDDQFLLETFDGVTRRCLLFGRFGNIAANGLVVGHSTEGTNRDTPGTNLLKLVNGTITGNPAGGGVFYAAAGELHWVNPTGVDTTLTPAGGFTNVISPAALGAGNTADYAPAGFASATVVRQAVNAANSTLTGLAGGVATKTVEFFNISAAGNLILNNEDAGSAAANRFLTPNAAALAIRPQGGVLVWYDGTSSRWRVASAAA